MSNFPSYSIYHLQSNLGLCYENGTGVVKNTAESARMYQLASGKQ
jgi:TPR repeat protein